MNHPIKRVEFVQKYLDGIFAEDLHAKRVMSLANGALGVMTGASLAVSMIGQSLAQARGLLSKHAIKQVDRLLSNQGVVVWDMFAPWVAEVVGARKTIVVAMDWTDFDADDQATLALSLVTNHGRATPLLWLSVLKDELKDQRNDFEDVCLARLAQVLPEGVAVMILADRGSGSASYHPRMLLGILGYGYAAGVCSSRKLERATYDSVAFRFIAANNHPDHDTIAAFRRRFLKEIEGLFVQVLLLAREMGVLKMGTIGLDGTKIHANASRHSALSYEHAGKIEAQLKAEVVELMAKAEAADAADIPDGMSIPDELARREERLRKIAEARTKIEARAKERHAREMGDYEAKFAARDAKTAATGKKPGGKPPQPPTEGPLPSDQINLTDEDSRVMPVAGGGFEQCYNAQAAVAAGSLLVVAVDVVQAPNDKQQLAPMLGKIGALPEDLGDPETLLADTGYFSAANVEACEKAGS